MLRKPIPLWIIAGGFALTLIGGCINAVGFLSLYHQALSHMSGTLCALGFNLATEPAPVVWHSLRVLVSFFFGALLSGFILRQSTLKAGRRYGVTLAVESALLFAAVHAFRVNSVWGVYFAAAACGLQNAMASSYSGTVIRTTHVTGMVTDLGIACGHMLRRQPVEWRRFKLYAALMTGFFAGSYMGAVSFVRIGYDTLLFPAALAGATGLGYAIFKHIERRQFQRSEQAALRDLPRAPDPL
ncbi:DUF1275 domain-containing protein [Opitutaceae bacterium EW11]|nr:DUF1275 domain-containing protein [Opitutaceae bacterium EW11]